MLFTSFNLRITPKSAMVLVGFTGTITTSLILELIDQYADKDLARELHDAKIPKPISVTPFILDGKPLFGGNHIVEANKPIEFRVSVIGELGLRLAEVMNKVGDVRVGGVDARLELSNALIMNEKELFRDRGSRVRLEFLTPVRFARKPLMRRRKPMFDFCPTPVNIARSTMIHMERVAKISPVRSPVRFLRWVYTYVFMRDMMGRVVATKHGGRPELGFLGSVEFEINSARRSRREQFWALLNYAEFFNVGTGRSMGFGHFRLKTLD